MSDIAAFLLVIFLQTGSGFTITQVASYQTADQCAEALSAIKAVVKDAPDHADFTCIERAKLDQAMD